MIYILYFLIFISGSCIASYICAYLYRNKNKKNLPKRSICEKCKRELCWYENIPVFSYIFLWGKCKMCKNKIDLKYFISEIVLGLWFIFSFIYYLGIQEGKIYFVLSCILGSLLLYISLEDYESQEISSYILYTIIFIALLKNVLFLDVKSLFWALFISLPYWLIYFISRGKWIGIADPFLFTSLNIFFGPQFAISLFLYSAWFGVVFAYIYLKNNKNNYIPYVPIIFFSTLVILIFQYHIITIQDILVINEIIGK